MKHKKVSKKSINSTTGKTSSNLEQISSSSSNTDSSNTLLKYSGYDEKKKYRMKSDLDDGNYGEHDDMDEDDVDDEDDDHEDDDEEDDENMSVNSSRSQSRSSRSNSLVRSVRGDTNQNDSQTLKQAHGEEFGMENMIDSGMKKSDQKKGIKKKSSSQETHNMTPLPLSNSSPKYLPKPIHSHFPFSGMMIENLEQSYYQQQQQQHQQQQQQMLKFQNLSSQQMKLLSQFYSDLRTGFNNNNNNNRGSNPLLMGSNEFFRNASAFLNENSLNTAAAGGFSISKSSELE